MTVIEGELVENAPTALAVREEVQSGIMPTVSPDEARAQMRAYQELCAAVLVEDDYQEFTETKTQKVDGRWLKVATTKRFKKKSAVKKLQTYFGISVDVIDDATHRDDLGEGHFGFRCKAVATSPGGRSVAALAGCATHEERFDVNRYDDESNDRYAARLKKALARSYHDVLSTAETRATNRAVMNLVSPGEVTAEEISRPGKNAPPAEQDPNDLADQAAAAARRSQPVVRVPQAELLALAAGHDIHGLAALGEWCVKVGIAPDLMRRDRKVLTDAETVAAKQKLEDMIPASAAPRAQNEAPQAARATEGPRMTAKTQGYLFRLLGERVSLEQPARHAFAAAAGITLPVKDGAPTFSGLSAADARTLIEKLEVMKPIAAIEDPDDLLAAAHERGLLL